MTQLTLSLDRDSALVVDFFDERNKSVKEMVRMVIEKAKKHDHQSGICCQAPAISPNLPDF